MLILTPPEIRRKFLELEYLQGERLTQSLVNTHEDSKWRLDDSPEVSSRNRYSNIAAWEYNRIKLKVPEEHCDYINASPITLTSRKDNSFKRYICTQVCRPALRELDRLKADFYVRARKKGSLTTYGE